MSINNLTPIGVLRQLTWKQWIGVIICLSSIIGFVHYLSGEHIKGEYEIKLLEKQKQINEYEFKWSQIIPYLSKSTLQYNIEAHLVRPHSKEIPRDSNVINREFVVGKTTPGLIYYQTTTLQHVSEIFETGTYGCFDIFFDLAPLHIWKGEQLFESIESSLHKKIFPYISVQKIPKVRLQNKLLSFFECLAARTTEHNNSARSRDSYVSDYNQFSRRVVKIVNDIGRRDIVGLYFSTTQFLRLLMILEYPEVTWKASEVQMVNQNLISSTIRTEKDVRLTIGNETKICPEFYVRCDVILVNAARYIYVVEIISPDTKFTRDAGFEALVTQWLSGFWMIDD